MKLDFELPSGRCRGICKGERAANEGPQEWAYLQNGKKVLMCSCCNERLVYKPVDFTTGSPNVIPGLERKEYRFEDKACFYDVVVLRGIK
jgi:hypothetical protein